MVTNFKLLQNIHSQSKEMVEHKNLITQRLNEMDVLVEDVTHVLANIATKAGSGEEIQAASAESLGAFMAGVEALAQKLPTTSNEAAKKKVISIMANMQINPDGTITTNVQPVAEYGIRMNASSAAKYSKLFRSYENTISQGNPDGIQLVQAAKRLQQEIDRALRTSMAGTQATTQ